MSDAPNDRLQRLRREAGFPTASEAARAFGWNENTYRSHENGERGLTIKSATRYSIAYNSTAAWLLTGEGKGSTRFAIPVRGSVMNKGMINFIKIDEEEEQASRFMGEISLDFALPEGAWCYVVSTWRLEPTYAHGDLLICWSRKSYDPDDLIDGIIWVGKKEGGLQLCLPDLSRRTRAQHRFGRELQHNGALFEPVELVVPSGRYHSLFLLPEAAWADDD